MVLILFLVFSLKIVSFFFVPFFFVPFCFPKKEHKKGTATGYRPVAGWYFD
jgi:hypothetical protein